MLLARNNKEACSLCGSRQNLTGEHKIKASSLKREFGADEKLMIGGFGSHGERLRLLQSARSKALHFAAKLCGPCNHSRTQECDVAFEKFNDRVRDLVNAGRTPDTIEFDEQFEFDTIEYHNVFRYFAKILCCQMADAGAPRIIGLAEYALGDSWINRVFLHVRLSPTYTNLTKKMPGLHFAAHGGLIIRLQESSTHIDFFESSITIGPVEYVFKCRLRWNEMRSLRRRFPEYYLTCLQAVVDGYRASLANSQKI